MEREILRDDQWERIKDLLPGKPGDPGCTARDNRKFVEAVFWIARTGSPWRDMPESLGHWHRVYVRFSRWAKQGVWQRIFEAVSDDPDLEQIMVDSTIIKAHQHSAGAKKKRGSSPSVDPEVD